MTRPKACRYAEIGEMDRFAAKYFKMSLSEMANPLFRQDNIFWNDGAFVHQSREKYRRLSD